MTNHAFAEWLDKENYAVTEQLLHLFALLTLQKAAHGVY